MLCNIGVIDLFSRVVIHYFRFAGLPASLCSAADTFCVICIRTNSRGRFPVEEQLLTRAYSKGLNIKPVTDPCKHDVQRLSQAASYISRGDGL